MTDDSAAIDRLNQAGFAVHALTEEQQEVLRGLTSHELDLLVDIKSRLDEVGPEVQAHSEIAGGALF
ncbi:aroma-sacti cluster domain-containing protein [Streptomyces sp. NPDC086787]|uniref:aroma-sacti cluster domain-containing protein n=1 Tax=Streptomyces sp. NPDC086787 TaxID=3365759 RepID=UPI00380117EE